MNGQSSLTLSGNQSRRTTTLNSNSLCVNSRTDWALQKDNSEFKKSYLALAKYILRLQWECYVLILVQSGVSSIISICCCVVIFILFAVVFSGVGLVMSGIVYVHAKFDCVISLCWFISVLKLWWLLGKFLIRFLSNTWTEFCL